MSHLNDTHWMLEGASAPSRAARAEAIARNLDLAIDDEESRRMSAWLAAPERYAFVLGMTGTGDQAVYRVVGLPTRQAILAYFDELDLSEWVPHTVLDLDAGEEVPIYLGLSFAPIAPQLGEEVVA